MSYKNSTGSILSKVDYSRLFYQIFTPENKSSGKNIVIQHGFGEHSGRYQNVLDAFENKGYTFYIMDSRGHGRSQGDHGVLMSFRDFEDDLNTFLEFIETEHKVKKPILIGHSMGGLIALNYLLNNNFQDKIQALVVNGAAIKPNLTLAMQLKLAAGKLIFLVAPDWPIPTGLDLKFISHDQQVVDAYKNDPLVHGVISVRMANLFLEAGENCMKNASKLRIPVLLTHGAEDGIANPEGTKEFYDLCTCQDKTLILYEGLYHETYNELGKEKVLSDLSGWVEKHTK